MEGLHAIPDHAEMVPPFEASAMDGRPARRRMRNPKVGTYLRDVRLRLPIRDVDVVDDAESRPYHQILDHGQNNTCPLMHKPTNVPATFESKHEKGGENALSA